MACEACVMFPPWKTNVLCSFCPCSSAHITHSHSLLVFFLPFRIIMPQGMPCLWRTRSRATLSSLWTKVTVKPAWAFRGPSCRVISKTSKSLWDIQTLSPNSPLQQFWKYRWIYDSESEMLLLMSACSDMQNINFILRENKLKEKTQQALPLIQKYSLYSRILSFCFKSLQFHTVKFHG